MDSRDTPGVHLSGPGSNPPVTASAIVTHEDQKGVTYFRCVCVSKQQRIYMSASNLALRGATPLLGMHACVRAQYLPLRRCSCMLRIIPSGIACRTAS